MKPLFLLVGGWATDRNVWRALAPALARHGEVQYAEWWELIGDVTPRFSFLRPDGGERPVVGVGWSLGSMLLLDAASFYKHAFDRLVLISPTARMTADEQRWPGTPLKLLRAMQLRMKLDSDEVLREFFKLCFKPGAAGDKLDGMVECAERLDPDVLVRGLQWLARADLRECLPVVATPSLIIHGSHDAVIPADAARAMVARMPHARLKILPGESHALPLTRAGALYEAIEAWMHG